MKRKLTLLYLFNFWFALNAQQENLGVVIEYSEPIDVAYSVYSPPLRINQVQSQNKIDYSNLKGLIQSFYSASNMEWALSDYINENAETSRDEEHFEAVKKTDVEKNYIQMETVYQFNYQNREMAYIKYSFIMDQVPFPFIGIMSAEKSNGRWYISNLLNQEAVFTTLTNIGPDVIKQLFEGQSDDEDISNIIDKTKKDNSFSFYKMSQIYDELMNNEEIENKIKDKRLMIEGYEYRNAIVSATASTSNYKVSNPFVLGRAVFSEYTNRDKGILNDDKGTDRYAGQPELIVLKETPIDFVHKFEFTTQGHTYYIIKYIDSTSNTVLIEDNGGSYSLSNANQYNSWVEFFSKIKGDAFIDLFNEDDADTLLKKVIANCKGSNEGINLDILTEYFKENQGHLQKYIEE